MAAPIYTYEAFGSEGNEPDFTRTNQMAAEGWRLAFFNGDIPDGGGSRQWIYVMEKLITGPVRSKKKKKK